MAATLRRAHARACLGTSPRPAAAVVHAWHSTKALCLFVDSPLVGGVLTSCARIITAMVDMLLVLTGHYYTHCFCNVCKIAMVASALGVLHLMMPHALVCEMLPRIHISMCPPEWGLKGRKKRGCTIYSILYCIYCTVLYYY